MTSTRRALIGTVAPTITAILPAFLIGAVAVQAREDLGFSEAGLGIAEGVFFLGAAITSIGLGRLAEGLGPARAMRLGAGLSVIVDLGVAASPTFGWVLVFLFAGGLSNALVQPAANIMVARLIRPGRHGLAFGIKQSSMPAATLLGGLAVPVFALTVGWRWSFVAAAVFGVAAIVAVPRGVGDRGRRRARGAAMREGDAALVPLLVLALGVGLGAAAAGAMAGFLVTGGVEVGLGPGIAGLALTVGSAVGIACRLWVGARADRHASGHLRVVAAMLLGGAAAVLLLAIGIPWVYLVGTLLVFGAGWGWPGLFNLSVVRNNPNAPGASTGITQTGTYVGAVVGPLAFGAVAEGASFAASWLVVAGCYVVAAGAMLLGRRLLRASLASATDAQASEVGPWSPAQ
jgi:MFS family permease